MLPVRRPPVSPMNPFELGQRRRQMPDGTSPRDQYGALHASLLYCPQCKRATPTQERLLLVLPNGNLYEYRCAQCGTSTGSKTHHDQPGGTILLP